jgi:voltage-gated potassium channel
MNSRDAIAEKIEQKIEKPMIILALLIIPVLLVEFGFVTTNPSYITLASLVDDLIWFIFFFEYLLLVSLYSDKLVYTKRNWLNILILVVSPPVISPTSFASIRALRSLRALRFLRILIPLKRGVKPITDVLTKNSFHYVTLITFLLIVVSGILFGWIEHKGINEGVWWAVTTVTTVGYGDLYPESNYGRLFATFLMLIGIGFASVLTGNISSYFVAKDATEEVHDINTLVETNEILLERLDELSIKIDELNEKVSRIENE